MSDRSQFALLRERRFAPFFGVQFLGAFNDNVYKNALIILIAFGAAELTSLDSGLLVNLCAAIFILPYFLFSATAGQLADKFEKSRVIRFVKLAEIGIMIIGTAGFVSRNLTLLLVALFLMGVHSTVFGPVKYAVLPQQLKPEELIGGNGLIEMGTFVAILLGTITGGVLIGIHPNGEVLVSATVLALACAGYGLSRSVPVSPAAAPDLKINWNPLTETWHNFQFMRGNRTVFLSVLGISWFWFYGAMFLSQFPNYGKDVLGGNEQVVTLLLALFSIGIGTGSLACERLSGHKVEIGLVPFGSIGLSLFALDLYFASPGLPGGETLGAVEFLRQPGGWRVAADLVLIGVFGGFYAVPLYALIQSRSDVSHRSRLIAGNNILNAFFMVLAAGLAILCLKLGFTIPEIFLLTAALNALVAVYIYTLVPEFLMRFIVWMLIHLVYRLDKSGLENVPDDGAAVVVCNHVSFVDALIIAAACRRPIRFVMDHAIFRVPVLNFVFRTGRCIPIASARENPGLLEKAYEEVAHGLSQGDLICIFPEGRITDTGEMYPFRPGISRIVQRTPVPVVPMALRGLWGNFFSRKYGPAMSKPSRLRLFYKIGLAVGKSVPPQEVTPEGMQALVLALRGDMR